MSAPHSEFKTIVNQTIALARSWHAAGALHVPLVPVGQHAQPNLLEAVARFESLPEKRDYVDFLQGQDLVTLQRLGTLLYFGAEEYDHNDEQEFHELHELLNDGRRTVEVAADILLRKSPDRVADWLAEGVSRARDMGIDLEGPFGAPQEPAAT